MINENNEEDVRRARLEKIRAEQLEKFIEFVNDENEDPEFREPALFLSDMGG